MAIPSIAIYGLGRFGSALQGALLHAGLPAPRTGGRASGPGALLTGLPQGSLVVLAVPDDAIPDVARKFAAAPGAALHSYVHACGAYGPGLLQPLADAGAHAGAFHILQTFPVAAGFERVKGSWCALAGPDALVATLRELGDRIGLETFELDDEGRAAYHAAAVLASNAVTALLAIARDLVDEYVADHSYAAAMFQPLMLGAIRNSMADGPEGSLTGPVVRGDVGTIRRHLEVLKGPTRRIYIAAMLAAADLAERSGRTDPARLAQIRKLLEQA